jgi:hypothetical protein
VRYSLTIGFAARCEFFSGGTNILRDFCGISKVDITISPNLCEVPSLLTCVHTMGWKVMACIV